jgi:hypothetical protein
VDGIKESLDRLSELDEGALSDLESQIIAEFETLEKQADHNAASVDAMSALADALDTVRNEQTTRAAAQADLEKRAAEASSRVHAATDTPAEDEEKKDEEPVPGEEPPSDAPAPAKEEEDEDKKVPATFSESDPEPAEQTAPPEGDELPEPSTDPGTGTETGTPDTTPGNTPTGPDNEPAPPSNDTEVPAQPDATVQADVAVDVTPSEAPAVTAEVTAPVAPSIENKEIPVAASAHDVVVTPPADSLPVARESATVSITAGADIPGISAGTELSSVKEVAEAFTKRLHNLQRVQSPNGQQYTVVTLQANYPEERKLYSGDHDGNWEKISKVTAPPALIAAGACVPLEIRYDIFGTGVTDTPIADMLPRFTADRGGIRFTPGPLLPAAGYDAGFGVWQTDGTVADFEGGDLAGAKPCYQVTCIPPQDVEVEALSMCLCFDNLTTRVFPELVAAHNDLALVQWARLTEQRLLAKIEAAATSTITATGVLGAAREILGQVDKVAAALRYRNRLAPNQPLRAIFPSWLRDMVRADVAYQMPGDGFENTLALADNALNGWFRSRNINVTWSLEAAAGNTAVPTLANIATTNGGFPATVEWDLFAEGTFLMLDGGTLDLGVIRDSTHVASNTYCEFAESWLEVVRIGGESVHVTSTISANGQAAALQDTVA